MLRSGGIDHRLLFLVVFCLGCAWTDFKYRKIYNYWILPFAFIGMAFYYFSGRLSWDPLLGFALGFALAFPSYLLGYWGAGDVKFLMVLGLWGGPKYVLSVTLYSILLGGIFAIIQLTLKKRWPGFLQKILLLRVPGYELSIDEKLTLPFGIPISIAGIVLVFWEPFQWM